MGAARPFAAPSSTSMPLPCRPPTSPPRRAADETRNPPPMRLAIRPGAIDEAQTRRAAAGCIPMVPRTALGLRLVASLWRPGRRLRWYLWGFSGMCHCISRESHCRVCGRAAGAVSGDDAAVSVLRGVGVPSLACRVVTPRPRRRIETMFIKVSCVPRVCHVFRRVWIVVPSPAELELKHTPSM